MPKKIEFNLETGEEIISELTDYEIAIGEEIAAQQARMIEEQNLREETEAALVESARDKLKALGLSDEEVNAILGPGPVVVTDVVNLDPATEEPAPVEEPVADEAAE